jgi:hypothetical protein
MAEVHAALRRDPLMNSIRPVSTQPEKQVIVGKETTAHRRHVGQTSARLRNHIKYSDGLRLWVVQIPTRSNAVANRTKPVSIRLTSAETEQLQARAYAVSGTMTGIARDLIRCGLAVGDNKSLADRLMLIERRIVALEQQGRDTNARTQAIDRAAHDLLAMFDALLKALTGDSAGRAA